MKEPLRIFFVAAALALAVSVADSPQALAVGGPAPGCSTHNNSLIRSGTMITQYSTQSCDGLISGPTWRQLTSDIARSRWYGWETMGINWSGWRLPAFYSQVYATYDCAGTGTHTFRGRAYGEMWPGIFPTSESREARWSC